MIPLRIFSEQGIDRFREYIQKLKDNPNVSRPDLNAEPYSSEFPPVVTIDKNKTFSTRMEMGEYLTNCFRDAGIDRENVIGNNALWTWLAYIWFDQICPVINETRKIRETARYICSYDYTDYYRHYVAASYDIYSLHGEDNSRLFLYLPVHIHNDFIEQIASRQYIISNTNLIEVAHRLYWDNSSGRPRRGALVKDKNSPNYPGCLRRTRRIFEQLELTYDIYTMTPDEILNLLPEEFNSWKGSDG
jgi:hypothetical protein